VRSKMEILFDLKRDQNECNRRGFLLQCAQADANDFSPEGISDVESVHPGAMGVGGINGVRDVATNVGESTNY
jgi:hypothetical protein